jgi:hypothetical protein
VYIHTISLREERIRDGSHLENLGELVTLKVLRNINSIPLVGLNLYVEGSHEEDTKRM